MITWQEIIEAEEPGERIHYGSLCAGIEVYRQSRSLLVIPPDDGFRVMCTGYCNGGFVESPEAVVNTTGFGGDLEMTMMPEPLEVHNECSRMHFSKLGLDPDRVVSLSTAANMGNAALYTAGYDGGEVSIAITGGVRGNGGRAGDPAKHDEAVKYLERKGTIITILCIDAPLSDGAMLDAMTIAVETKSCVLQELMARSLYSTGIATGSGTDQVAIVCRKGDDPLESIGRDSGLAEAIAECVWIGLYETLDRQSAMNHVTQLDCLVSLSRFGITPRGMREELRFDSTMSNLDSAEKEVSSDPRNASVFYAMLAVHDRTETGLVEPSEGLSFVKRMCQKLLLDGMDLNPVMRLRLERTEDIPTHLRLVLAIMVQQRATELGGCDYVQ